MPFFGMSRTCEINQEQHHCYIFERRYAQWHSFGILNIKSWGHRQLQCYISQCEERELYHP